MQHHHTMQGRCQAPIMQPQQRLQQALPQADSLHVKRQLRHNRSSRSTFQLSAQAVQTAERPAAAYTDGREQALEERISSFDGRGIAVVSPPLTDIQLPLLRDSRHKVLA